ncbi:hypothetical protein PRIPAC_93174 [Pristionchus pacificus]|uniref:Uncharacterized protein n=1 Tax=Pristionchus pacificus TaxID=54126 RepID=A0A454Y678_PRIPA|nr:hypothetical protein PRIPAC_93174 [Pristionchus pacificus]|eukprot:PDM65850.1 hypothetical protein PRIPAC_44129 [Pristionchus pacificus]
MKSSSTSRFSVLSLPKNNGEVKNEHLCKNMQAIKSLMENPQMVAYLHDELPEKYQAIIEMMEKAKK